MLRSRRFGRIIFAAAISASLAHPALAQLTKINVGYSAISGDALPAWVAKDAGIFESNGLDVQPVFFTGGTTAATSKKYIRENLKRKPSRTIPRTISTPASSGNWIRAAIQTAFTKNAKKGFGKFFEFFRQRNMKAA